MDTRLKALALVVMVWPPVIPVHRVFTFIHPGQGGRDTPALVFVPRTEGGTVYKLECHNGNYDDASEMNFSGDFQCALYALQGGRVTSGNLLADSSHDQQTSDWLFNRGRMLSVQLSDACGSYPEFGLVRHFRVRGMRVTLEFGGLQWSTSNEHEGLDQFTVDLTVEPDLSAQTETSETAAAPRPPTRCGW
jgi:hypothetical protein